MTSLGATERRGLPGLGAVLALAVVGVILWTAGADRAQISAAAADPQAYVTAAGADEFVLVLATAIGWLLLGWVCVGAVLVLGSAVPGWIGWLFSLLVRLLLPTTLHRFISLALGIAMLSGTTAASAAPAAPAESVSVSVDWPAATGPAISSVPDWPPAPDQVDAEPEPEPPTSGTYTVQPGDCLWDIAERALAQAGRPVDVASVAAAVTRWWQSNPGLIQDPDVIFPGQVLQAPAP